MLTATYSFVALATEQDNARSMLTRAQQFVQSAWHSLQGMEALETAIAKLIQFDKYCRQRKLELHLMPLLRRIGGDTALLLGELDALAERAYGLLRSVRATVSDRPELPPSQLGDLWHGLYQYCEAGRERLDREERELFPLARRTLSVEDWFRIAAQFLSDDRPGSHARRGSSSRRSRPAHAIILN
ncbi:hypothetical protein E4K72_05315 [Oxalobacteraceae bacterium OM1]|nr:hypothetical protein E4K72_05315 [Oxalobacteraceae bacterium OM1]